MIDTLMKKTEAILAKYPKARDDDKYLVLALWWNFYRENLTLAGTAGYQISFDNYFKLPSSDFITRCRRKIQEAGKYLPTVWEVAERRKINEETWREYMQA